ncbi:MAG: peptidoglycan-binding protein [Pseudomonadota bacterium]
MAMRSENPWSIKGITPDMREQAKGAARRAGMTVGQWLNAVIAESSADLRRAQLAMPRSDMQSPVAGQIAAMQDQLAELANAINSGPALHRSIAPSNQNTMPGSFGTQHPIEDDVIDMAAAVQGLASRVFEREQVQRQSLGDVSTQIEALSRRLDQMNHADNRVPPMADPASGYGLFPQTANAAGGQHSEAAPWHSKAEASIHEKIAQLNERLTSLSEPQSSLQTPKHTTAANGHNELENRILASVDHKLSGLEDQLSFIAQRLDTPAPSQPIARGQEPSRNLEVMSHVQADLEKLQGDITSVLATQRSNVENPVETRAQVQALQTAIAGIEDRMAGLAHALTPEKLASGVAQHIEPSRKHSKALMALVDTVSELRSGIDQVSKKQADMETVYAERIEEVSRADAANLKAIEERFDALATRIEETKAERSPELDLLRNQVAELSSTIHSTIESAKPDLAPFDERLRDLSDRIDGALHASVDADNRMNDRLEVLAERISTSAPDLSGLQARIEDMSRAIQNTVTENKPDASLIEARLRAMAERIEAALAPGAAHIPAEVYRVEDRLEDIQNQLATAVQSFASDRNPNNFQVFDQKLQSIQERMDTMLSDPRTNQVSNEIGALNQRVQDIATRIDTVFSEPINQKTDLSPIEARIEALSAQLESTAGKIREPLPDAVLLDSRLRDMTSRIEQSLEKSAPDLSRIEARIDALTQHVDQQVQMVETPASEAALAAISAQVKSLSDRLDQARQNASDPSLPHQIETQIAELSQKFEAQQKQIRSIENIERALNHFFDAQPNPSNIATEAARIAAQDVVREIAGDGTRPHGQMMFELEERVNALREEAALADQRTRETLATVQDALLTVVKRMRTLEMPPPVAQSMPSVNESTSIQTAPTANLSAPAPNPAQDFSAPPPAPFEPEPVAPQPVSLVDAPQPPQPRENGTEPNRDARAQALGLANGLPTVQPDPEPEEKPGLVSRILERAKRKPKKADEEPADELSAALETVSSAPDEPIEPEPDFPSLDDDAPLAPTTGEPAAPLESKTPPRARILGRDGAVRSAPESQTDFIAAARRAAQAAAEASTPIEPQHLPKNEAKPSASERLQKIKKPLIAGTAIVLVLVGTLQVASILRGVSERSVATAPTAVGSQEAALDIAAPTADQTAVATADDGLSENVLGDIEASTAAGELTLNDDVRVIPTAPSDGSDGDALALSIPDGASDDSSIEGNAGGETAADMLAILPSTEFPENLRLAAASGDADAQFEIASRYVNGEGAPKDVFKAAEWYARSAAQGLAPAQYRLGSLYEQGNGLAKNLDIAKMWYERSAEQGNLKSMHNLAVLYAEGVNGEPDFRRASNWFTQAAQLGLPDSQFNLGILYARGLGVEQNMAESYKWFALAADSGDQDAIAKRDELEERIGQDALVAARLAVQSFSPLPTLDTANVVPQPAGGWGEVNVALAPASAAAIDRDTIRQAQSLLNDLGFGAGTADGIVGERTADAIRSFQKQSGLPETGLVTPELMALLKAGST